MLWVHGELRVNGILNLTRSLGLSLPFYSKENFCFENKAIFPVNDHKGRYLGAYITSHTEGEKSLLV